MPTLPEEVVTPVEEVVVQLVEGLLLPVGQHSVGAGRMTGDAGVK